MPDSFFQAADIQPMLDGVGVDVTIGGVTAKCARDLEDEQLMQEQSGALVGKVRSVLAKTGTFATLTEGSAITVEGLSCSIISAHQVGDGAMTRIRCRKV